jgi:metacaspase-1
LSQYEGLPGFDEENIVILMDDGKHIAPTRSNILDAYQSVVAQSKEGDVVFCHYSGESL